MSRFADCGRLSYKITENYKRVVTLQISTNTAIKLYHGLAAGIYLIIKMKALKVTYSRLISKGNYENAKIEIELEVKTVLNTK